LFSQNQIKEEEDTPTEGLTSVKETYQAKPHYSREDRQNDIEQRVMAQLGDRFRHGKLLEISENSYLITGGVRLPVFGKSFKRLERTKSSISKKAYLLGMHPEYTVKFQKVQMEKLTAIEGGYGQEALLKVNDYDQGTDRLLREHKNSIPSNLA
jgi:hypothetical protein